jgi:hypothetical protein
MKLKGFKQFITEKQTDPELVKKMQEYSEGQGDTCPRCGKVQGECKCADRDYGSTVNFDQILSNLDGR